MMDNQKRDPFLERIEPSQGLFNSPRLADTMDDIYKLEEMLFGYPRRVFKPDSAGTVIVGGGSGGAGSSTAGTVVADSGQAERNRITALLSTFRDNEPSSRRDWELARVARNKLLDELDAWLKAGALPYKPKD